MSLIDKFNKFFGSEKSEDEHEAELPPQQEQETSPDDATKEMIEQLNSRIADSENLSGGLGRLAKEKIFTGGPEYDEIYMKEATVDLKGENDALAFESAGTGLKARNAIKRVVTLGLAGSKYAMKDEGGLVDKRKLREEVKGKEYRLYPDELKGAEKKFGLGHEKMKPGNFSKKYVEREDGVEKIITGKGIKTEQEMEETAGEILARRLDELQKEGVNLIAEKQALERFDKDLTKAESILPSEDLAGLTAEREMKNEAKNSNQQELNDRLKAISEPLLEHRDGEDGLKETLTVFSDLLIGASATEATFNAEIKGLQEKMNAIRQLKELSETAIVKDRVTKWEEQQAQAKVNLEGFRKEKARLNERINALKKDLVEVDRTLARIDNIGKTKEELGEEQAVKQRAEKARREAEAEKNKGAEAAETTAPAGSTVESNESDDDAAADQIVSGLMQAGFGRSADSTPIELSESEVVAPLTVDSNKPKGPTAESNESDDDSTVDDEIEEQIRRNELIDKIDQAANEPGPRRRTKDRVPPAAEAPVVQPAAGEPAPETEPAGDSGKREKEPEIVRPVRFWLNAIFGGTLEKPIHDKIMRRHFRLGKIFDKFTGMTAKQAEIALYGFQIEAEGFRPVNSREEARKKIGQILENIDDYDHEKGEAASSKPVRREARLEQPAEATRENIVPGLAEAFGKAAAKDWDRNIKGGDASGGGLALPPEQAKTKAANKRKPIDQGKRNLTDENRAARKLRKQELTEAALKDEARLEGKAETQQNPAGVPKSEDKKNPPINGLKSALEKAEALAKAKAGNQVDGSGQVEAPATVAPAPEAESGEKEIKWSLKRWKKVLGLRDNTVEANRAIKKNFMPSPGSVDEALEAFKRYKTAMGEMPKAFDENAIKQLIKNNIEASLK